MRKKNTQPLCIFFACISIKMKRFLDSYTEIERDISTLRNYVWKLIDELQNAGYLASGTTPLAFTISGNAVTSTVPIITRNIQLRENTVANGDNYITIKAPAELTSNFTLNVKGENGTIALLEDITTNTSLN